MLTALVAVLGTGCAATPAQAAITRAQANRIALQALAPQSAKGRVVVYTLRQALGPRDVVFQANPRARKRIRFRRPGRARWFFWMDLLQDALFAHPSKAVTIDAATGRVLQRQNFSWYPLVNGHKPPYLRSVAAYHSPRWQIYSNLPRTRSLSTAPAQAADYRRRPIRVPRDRFKDDCLLTIGDSTGQFKGGIKAITGWAKAVGIRTYKAKPSKAGLDDKVDDLEKGANHQRKCKDIFIYLHGHGIPPRDVDPVSGGPAGTVANVRHDVLGNNIVNEDEIIRPTDLESVIRSHPKVTFKVKIMSCFSGRFIDDIERGGQPPNLKVMETSSNSKLVSFFHLPGVLVGNDILVNPTDNPDDADEFTNGNVHGLYEWATSPDTGADNDLVNGIVQSFTLGAKDDFARNLPDSAQLPVDDAGNRVDLKRTDPQLRDYRSAAAIGLYLDVIWMFAGANEVQLRGQAMNRAGVLYRQSSAPLTEVRVVVPGGRQIINQLCPSQLPAVQVTTTTSNNDTLVCSGGSLPLGQTFTLNVRTSPNPSTGMGGQSFGRQDGQLKGPFAISGP